MMAATFFGGLRVKRLTGLLVQCCLLVVGCSPGPQLSVVPADGVILAFGDSLTAGTGATADTSYPAVLSRLADRRVMNAGVPGEVTAAGLARLPELLDRESRLWSCCAWGGMDFLQRLDAAKAEENLRAMIRMIRERNISVVLIGVPRLGLGLEVPEWYERIAKDAGIPYEGKALKRILGERTLKSDTVHPNAHGYQQMAEAVLQLLKNPVHCPEAVS